MLEWNVSHWWLHWVARKYNSKEVHECAPIVWDGKLCTKTSVFGLRVLLIFVKLQTYECTISFETIFAICRIWWFRFVEGTLYIQTWSPVFVELVHSMLLLEIGRTLFHPSITFGRAFGGMFGLRYKNISEWEWRDLFDKTNFRSVSVNLHGPFVN